MCITLITEHTNLNHTCNFPPLDMCVCCRSTQSPCFYRLGAQKKGKTHLRCQVMMTALKFIHKTMITDVNIQTLMLCGCPVKSVLGKRVLQYDWSGPACSLLENKQRFFSWANKPKQLIKVNYRQKKTLPGESLW